MTTFVERSVAKGQENNRAPDLTHGVRLQASATAVAGNTIQPRNMEDPRSQPQSSTVAVAVPGEHVSAHPSQS